MSLCYGTGRALSIWGFLAVVLFLGGVAFVEQLAPELETNMQDEQALAEFSYALKTDRVVIGSVSDLASVHSVSDVSASFPICHSPLRQERERSHFKPSTLRLHQKLSIYRI